MRVAAYLLTWSIWPMTPTFWCNLCKTVMLCRIWGKGYRVLSWTTFHKHVLFVSLIYFSLVLALKTIACKILESVNRLRFLLPDHTYYIIKTFCQPTAQDAEVSCTTVQLSAGQMVAQLAANRRCYLRRRCTQAQRPSTSQDVTYPQIEIDMWPRPGKRDYSFRPADWTIRGAVRTGPLGPRCTS